MEFQIGIGIERDIEFFAIAVAVLLVLIFWRYASGGGDKK
jgi:hypothetical protein